MVVVQAVVMALNKVVGDQALVAQAMEASQAMVVAQETEVVQEQVLGLGV